MKIPSNQTKWPKNQNRTMGMTLVELMIGLVIAMILLAGVAEIFLGSKQTYRYQSGMARLQENGRYALDIFAEKIRMAGYMGCFSSDTGNLVNTVNGGGAVDYDFSKPIIAWEATTSGYQANKDASQWTDAGQVPADIQALINGTPAGTAFSDILVFTGVGNSGIRLDSAMPNTSAVVKVAMHSPQILFDDDILLVSDCKKSAIFQATNVTYPSGGGGGTAVNVVHNTGSGTPGNSQKELSNNGEAFDTDASIFTLEKTFYFIAPSALNNNNGDTVMALWRKVNANAAEEMVAGVGNLQLLMGEDIDDDKSADRYGAAHLVDFENVISVRMTLTANTVERINIKTNVSDAIRTQTFSQTVQVRNRSL